MTHLRLWRFDVPAATEERFVEAYSADGDWARLFGSAEGFLKTELWRETDGAYVTADYWRTREDFERFQSALGVAYRALDTELEGISGTEAFLGAFDLVT
jgi:heme-degrading monooxygenase HmoA